MADAQNSSNEYSNDAAFNDANAMQNNAMQNNATQNNAMQNKDGSAHNEGVNEVTISIPSDASYIRVVRLAVMGVASRLALSFEDIEDLKLAVSEACNNAVLHARPTSAVAATVIVRLRTFSDRLEVSVEDDGFVPPPGLARAKHIAPTSPHDLPEGGMGLFLIETLMDKVEHFTGERTVIHMTKFLSPNALSESAPEMQISTSKSAAIASQTPFSPAARS